MPAINFQKRFAPLVESGVKTQTIRPKRKDGRNPHEGDTLYLYVGQRTKGCRKLGEGICTKVLQFILFEDGRVIVDTDDLDVADKDELAIKDGFKDFDEMYDFFSRQYWESEDFGLPFYGLLIEWDLDHNQRTFGEKGGCMGNY